MGRCGGLGGGNLVDEEKIGKEGKWGEDGEGEEVEQRARVRGRAEDW